MNKRDVRNFGLSLVFLLALVSIVLVPSLLHAMAGWANTPATLGPPAWPNAKGTPVVPASPSAALLNAYTTPASLPTPSDPNAVAP